MDVRIQPAGSPTSTMTHVLAPGHPVTVTVTAVPAGTQRVLLRAAIPVAGQSPGPLSTPVWRDIDLKDQGNGTWSELITPLQTGYWQYTCFAITADGSQHWWGQNGAARVRDDHAPARIYCAFTRQFHALAMPLAEIDSPALSAATDGLRNEGWAVLPPSGTFRGVLRELDHIFDRLGFTDLHLLPIHPTPTTFGRMGTMGSPYAALDFTLVDPALAEFDRNASPVDQLIELTSAVRSRGGRTILDLAINHTGWASWLQQHRPDWYVREENGAVHSPGAWGVTWEDLIELNHHNEDLVAYLADCFILWCNRGIDGFRCDAGYMLPGAVWQDGLRRVLRDFPATRFILEGLGGGWDATENLLCAGDMEFAYSELFQEFGAQSLTGYLNHCAAAAKRGVALIHYAETHDNDRLAKHGRAYALHRCQLSALTSIGGAWGITAGVEWLATEKIRVHRGGGLHWGNPTHICDEIAELNSFLATHPCFAPAAHLSASQHGECLIVERTHQAQSIFVLVNPTDQTQSFQLSPAMLQRLADTWQTLYGQAPRQQQRGGRLYLEPWHCCVIGQPALTADSINSSHLTSHLAQNRTVLARMIAGRYAPEAVHLQPEDWQWAVTQPLEFLQKLSTYSEETLDSRLRHQAAGRPAVVVWHAANDAERIRLWPACDYLAILHDSCPTLTLQQGSLPSCGHNTEDSRMPNRTNTASESQSQNTWQGEWLAIDGGKQWLGIFPEFARDIQRGRIAAGAGDAAGASTFMLALENRGSSTARSFPLLRLPTTAQIPQAYCAGPTAPRRILLTNGRGGMAHLNVPLGTVQSKYDCVLGANDDARWPVDRTVWIKQIRAWLQVDTHSHDLAAVPAEITQAAGTATMRWTIRDVRYGGVTLQATWWMTTGTNAINVQWQASADRDDVPLSLILRPDLECRSFHEESHLPADIDSTWDAVLDTNEQGFIWRLDGRGDLRATIDHGTFQRDGEVLTGIPHPFEATRGQTAAGDAWSPGFFRLDLHTIAQLSFAVNSAAVPAPTQASVLTQESISADAVATTKTKVGTPRTSLRELLHDAAQAYLVQRDDGHSVIAGYPWFLDWGRDTLISCRGYLAAGEHEAVRSIVLLYARYVDRGTLPNCIHGADLGNRDTSDAPLWLGAVAADYLAIEPEFLNTPLADSSPHATLLDALRAVVRGYTAGTPNGIQVDQASGLVWSPSHFTWMDTNYPAGTPRVGYPLEIQTLWWRLLTLLEDHQALPVEAPRAAQVQSAILEHFWLDEEGWLADGLWGSPGATLAATTRDPVLRCNVLLPVTFGLLPLEKARRVVNAVEQHLLIPGALRSLAPLPTSVPLTISDDAGNLLNNPNEPYWGHYEGVEDTHRKPAYHNGTGWGWWYPMFCEALIHAWPEDPQATQHAKSYFAALSKNLFEGCLGQLSENYDGDAPHTERGCDAQAWSVTEALRLAVVLDV
jgi:predicted glycogen debranching enzyme